MSDPLAPLQGAVESGDIMSAVDKAAGQYKDAVTADTNTMSKLPQSSLPQGVDPSPFTLGPLGSK
jgi:hypothetical protein